MHCSYHYTLGRFFNFPFSLVNLLFIHFVTLLVSTYVVCERLSVMHEPAGMVEILVQILQNSPYSEIQYSFRIPPPPQKIEIKADLSTLRLFSLRIPPPRK